MGFKVIAWVFYKSFDLTAQQHIGKQVAVVMGNTGMRTVSDGHRDMAVSRSLYPE